MFPLQSQVAVVTGGSRGIGAAIAKKLATLGAEVVVNYTANEARANEVVDTIRAAGGRARAMCFDVADVQSVETAFEQIMSDVKRIDILVNNAGIAQEGLIVRTRNEDWTKTIEVNLGGSFYCARAVTRPMMKARYGRIINISSVVGEMGNVGQAAYSASKAGVFGLTKSLARELASRGITVNAVTPGYIDTEMTSGMNDELRQKMLEQIPLKRLGNVDDVSELVAFLALPVAGYITGQVVGVNGGMYM